MTTLLLSLLLSYPASAGTRVGAQSFIPVTMASATFSTTIQNIYAEDNCNQAGSTVTVRSGGRTRYTITLYLSGYTNAGGYDTFLDVQLDGVPMDTNGMVRGLLAPSNGGTMSRTFQTKVLAAGTHTFCVASWTQGSPVYTTLTRGSIEVWANP